MIEYEINEFLALKLEEGKTHIYVNGKRFRQCTRLAITIPKQSIPIYNSIDSIDEAADLYQKHLYQNKIVEGPNARVLRDEVHDITPEQEFWGHCSNLQAWYEHNYDTRLLHSSLAFPLLKALVDSGDPDAKRVFRIEIADRFESGYPNTITSIFKARLLDYFSPEEKKELIQQNFPVILKYIENVSKHYPNMFPYIFEERLLDYLSSEEKTQLMQLNYPVILKYIQKISRSRYYPKAIRYVFEEILFDHLRPEEKKQVIKRNFPLILKDIEKIGKHYPNMFLYLFEERLLHYLSEVEKLVLIQKNYPIILKYLINLNYYPDKFIYIFDAGILDYLHPEDKSQLIQQNYLIIFKNIQKILKPEIAEEFLVLLYPKRLLDIFEERLFDYLSPEEKKQLIQQNFPVLLIYIRRISELFYRDNFMKRSESEVKISDKTLSYIYITVINAIKGTKLIDDFFNALAELSYISLEIYFAMFKAIGSIKTSNSNWRDVYSAFRNAGAEERKKVEEGKQKENKRATKKSSLKKKYFKKEMESISNKQVLPSYYRNYNPLKKQGILPKLDKELAKIIRIKRKQWIDYFGIVVRKKYQIYSNIESEYLEDQDKLDSIAESFFSGDLNEKIYKIYSAYLKECKGFQIPNFYFLEKDEITYIIIGIFRFARRAKLILKKMALVIENLNHKKVVDINNKVVDIDMLDKSGKEIIQYLMRTFTIDIEHYLFPKGKEKQEILLSILNYCSGHLN